MRFATALLLVLVIGVSPVQAQEARYTLVLRDVPLAEALGRLVALSEISLLYGPELDRNAPVYCAARELPAEAVLRCIVEGAGKDFYRLSSGTYVVIEPAEAPPQPGSLAGVVVCAETGAPLPYAHVLLADASAGTATNAAGLFVLAGLLPGEHRVVASYVGYQSASARVAVPAAGQARRRIALRPEPVSALPVVIDGLQQRLRSADLGLADLTDEAAGAEPARGSLAGARTALGLAVRPLTHSLHVQGGEAGEHQFRLDGVPVFEPISLGQLFGAFSPLAVDRVAVHKAGFGAAQGSFTAGLVELDHGLDPAYAATLTADPFAVNGRLHQRLTVGRRDVAVMAAGRYGLWDVWRMPALDRLLRDWNAIDPLLMAQATDPTSASDVFSPHRRGSDLGLADVHAAARVRLDPFRTVRAAGFHRASRVSTDLFALAGAPGAEPDRAAFTRDDYHWTNAAGHLQYAALLGARSLASAQLRASHHASRQAYAMTDRRGLDAATDFERLERELAEELAAAARGDHGNLNRMLELAAEARLDLSLASGQLLEVGLEAAHVRHRFELDGPFYRPLTSESGAWRIAAFAQDRRPLGRRTTLETGLRLTGIPERETVYAEPRVALRYDAETGPLGPYALRLATGLYRQFVNQFDVTAVGPSALVPSVRFWMPVDRSLAPPRALHAAAEALVVPLPGWTVRAEAYYKHLPRLLALDYTALLDHAAEPDAAPVRQDAFIAPGRGYAYGAGARLERTGERLRLRLGYDAGVSRRTFPGRFEGRALPTPWNEPHRALAAADLEALAGLTLRTQARAVWGRTWRFRQAYYDVLAAHDAPAAAVIGAPDAGRLPATYEVDLGLTYTLRLAGTRLAAGIDVLNVLDRANVLDYGLRAENGAFTQLPRETLGRHALLTLRLAR